MLVCQCQPSQVVVPFLLHLEPWLQQERPHVTVSPLSIQTITVFISVLNHDPEQQHASKWYPGVVKSKAIATLLSDQASDIVPRLYTAPTIGKRVNIYRKYSIRTFQVFSCKELALLEIVLKLEGSWGFPTLDEWACRGDAKWLTVWLPHILNTNLNQ